MNVHGNAKLGPSGRRALVAVVADGASLREAAARFGVSPATAHRWWTRWRQASEPSEARSAACVIGRVGPVAVRGYCQLPSSSGSVRPGGGRAGGHG